MDDRVSVTSGRRLKLLIAASLSICALTPFASTDVRAASRKSCPDYRIPGLSATVYDFSVVRYTCAKARKKMRKWVTSGRYGGDGWTCGDLKCSKGPSTIYFRVYRGGDRTAQVLSLSASPCSTKTAADEVATGVSTACRRRRAVERTLCGKGCGNASAAVPIATTPFLPANTAVAPASCGDVFGSFRYGASNILASGVKCSAARKTLRGWLKRLPSGKPTKPFPRKYAGWTFTDLGNGDWKATRKRAVVRFLLNDIS